MNIPTTYEYIKQNFPVIIDEFESRRAKSKAKNAKANLADFDFYFSVSQRVKGYSLSEVISMAKEKQPTENFNELDREKWVNDKVNRVIPDLGVRIYAKRNQYELDSDLPRHNIPNTVLDHYRENYEEEFDRCRRNQNLTPEQRDKEMQENLAKLRSMGGFMEFRI